MLVWRGSQGLVRHAWCILCDGECGGDGGESKPLVGGQLARITFIFSIIVGIASLAMSYWGTANATSVSVGDCRHYKVNTIDNCGSCVSMLSPSSKDGYLSTWVGNIRYNWLNIVALS